MSSTFCPACGASNLQGSRFCSKCGKPLVTLPAAPTQPPAAAPPIQYPIWSTDYLSTQVQYKRREQVDMTRRGLLLLIVGLLLGPVPFVGFIGGILAIIGAILVFLGRGAFGTTHSKHAVWAVGIYVCGIVILIIVSVGFFLSIFSAVTLARGDLSVLVVALISSFNDLLVGAIVGGAVTGIGVVLFTYALQNSTGRLLLWLAYATSLAFNIMNLAIIGPQVSKAVQAAVANGGFDRAPLDALQAEVRVIGLLGLIPAAIYAAAFYLARSRIAKGESPEQAKMHWPAGVPGGPF